MIFVDTVDMQDGDHEGSVDFDEELFGQGFGGAGQGGERTGTLSRNWKLQIFYPSSYTLNTSKLNCSAEPINSTVRFSG